MRSRNHFRVLQRKRYEARRFHNPYFAHAQKRNWKGIIAVLAIVVMTGALIGWAFNSPRFDITNVRVDGAESIDAGQISSKIWEELNRKQYVIFQSQNRFLFDEERLRELLSSTYAFESLNITRTCELFGNGGCSLVVTVKEKTSQLLWQSGERVYLADLQGIVIRELTTEEIEAMRSPDALPTTEEAAAPAPAPNPMIRLPRFYDMNAASISVGSSVLTPNEVSGIFLFQKRLQEAGIAFTVTKIDRLVGKWMAVETESGYDIMFDASGDIEAQAQRLTVLLRETIKDPTKLEYIDLRFGDHIYFK